MPHLKIAYGSKSEEVEISEKDLLIYKEPPAVPMSRDVDRKIKESLYNPIGGKALPDLVRGASKIALIVDSWARPLMTCRKVLPIVIHELTNCGIPNENITVVMGHGVGAIPDQKIIETRLGKSFISSGIKFVVSEPFKRERQVFFGFSRLGTPVWIDKFVANAEVKIGIGLITSVIPQFGGWSGGAKCLVPGVAGCETIDRNHALFIYSPFNSTDNPGFQDRREIATLVGLDMIVNVIPTPGGELADIVSGDVIQAHDKGINIYRDLYQVSIPKKADIIVTIPATIVGCANFIEFPRDFFEGVLPIAETISRKEASIIFASPPGPQAMEAVAV